VRTIKKKFLAALGLKGILCLASLVMIGLALVTYSSTVTITPQSQFTLGATSDSWTIYVNDVDKVRYLPSSGTPAGSQEPTFDDGNSDTYSFKVVTDADRNCAVKIELTSAVNSSKFSKFDITAKYWTGSAWTDETLYDAPTGSTTKSHIDGLVNDDAGYIHQTTSTTRYYLIKVTYSHDLVDETTQITVTCRYTPTPQEAF
jgi:hypothetical protein